MPLSLGRHSRSATGSQCIQQRSSAAHPSGKDCRFLRKWSFVVEGVGLQSQVDCRKRILSQQNKTLWRCVFVSNIFQRMSEVSRTEGFKCFLRCMDV